MGVSVEHKCLSAVQSLQVLLVQFVLNQKLCFVVISSGLVPLFIIYFSHSLFLCERPVDSLCIVIRNASRFACASDAVVFLMNKAHEFGALGVGDLYVLADHTTGMMYF